MNFFYKIRKSWSVLLACLFLVLSTSFSACDPDIPAPPSSSYEDPVSSSPNESSSSENEDDSSDSSVHTPPVTEDLSQKYPEDGLWMEEGYGLRFILLPEGNGYALFDSWGTPKDVVIPSEYKGLPVKAIGGQFGDERHYYPFRFCFSLQSIVIPESVEYIHATQKSDFIGASFEACKNLASIDIKNPNIYFRQDLFKETAYWKNHSGVTVYINTILVGYKNNPTDIFVREGTTNVHQDAFRDCATLTSIILPQSVKKIEARAFLNCTSLNKVTMSENITFIGDNAFKNCASLNEVSVPEKLEDIGIQVFDNSGYWNSHFGNIIYWNDWCIGFKNNPTQLTIAAGTKRILPYAFYQCEFAQSVSLPDSITEIGDYAFAYNASLLSVQFPDGLQKIGNYAFYDCYSLQSVELPNSLQTMGTHVFYHCSNLKQARFLTQMERLPAYTFYSCPLLEQVTFPENLQIIEDYAFKNCYALQDLALPSSLTLIKRGAFSNCKQLTRLSIPENVATIEEFAFWGCTGLNDLSLGAGLRNIEGYAFMDCTALTSVTLPSLLESFYYSTFKNCILLTAIRLAPTTEILGDAPFACSPNLELYYI